MAINVIVSQLGLPGLNGADGDDAPFSSNSRIVLFDDFLCNSTGGNVGWTTNVLSGGTIAITDSESNHSGIMRLSTGSSSSTAHAAFHLGTKSLYIGNGQITIEGLIRLVTLSTSSERYIFRFGLGDTTNTSFDNGIFLEYDEITSANWRICASASASATKTTSLTTVTENVWIKLKIVINAAGNSVEYFVNGTSIGTVATTIPTQSSPRIQIVKSVGTTARTVEIDYYSLDMPLSVSR